MDKNAEQIGRIERGNHNVSICKLRKIAVALNVSLSELLEFYVSHLYSTSMVQA